MDAFLSEAENQKPDTETWIDKSDEENEICKYKVKYTETFLLKTEVLIICSK